LGEKATVLQVLHCLCRGVLSSESRIYETL
jgi:hypothetical protein